MMALALCVLCSVLVSVLFKWARPRGLQAAQAVAVNYVVAIAATLILLRPNIVMSSLEAMPWGVLLLLGVLLPTVFVVMVQAVSHAGMVRADAAQRFKPVHMRHHHIEYCDGAAAGQRLARAGLAVMRAADAKSFLFQVFAEQADEFDVVIDQ